MDFILRIIYSNIIPGVVIFLILVLVISLFVLRRNFLQEYNFRKQYINCTYLLTKIQKDINKIFLCRIGMEDNEIIDNLFQSVLSDYEEYLDTFRCFLQDNVGEIDGNVAYDCKYLSKSFLVIDGNIKLILSQLKQLRPEFFEN